MHYTNLNAAEAYGAILSHLEQTCSDYAASDFDGIREFFEDVCQEYNVNGLDVGLTIKYKRRRPIGDVETFKTDGYIAVPAKLLQEGIDFSHYTKDKILLQAIELIRNELTAKGAPSVKGNRAMRGKRRTGSKHIGLMEIASTIPKKHKQMVRKRLKPSSILNCSTMVNSLSLTE
jgi:hypothetical protein